MQVCQYLGMIYGVRLLLASLHIDHILVHFPLSKLRVTDYNKAVNFVEIRRRRNIPV